jgi:hypothetical protein
MNPLIGINPHGVGSELYQNGSNIDPPHKHIDDSFRIFSESGICCIRVTFYWESFEVNRDNSWLI